MSYYGSAIKLKTVFVTLPEGCHYEAADGEGHPDSIINTAGERFDIQEAIRRFAASRANLRYEFGDQVIKLYMKGDRVYETEDQFLEYVTNEEGAKPCDVAEPAVKLGRDTAKRLGAAGSSFMASIPLLEARRRALEEHRAEQRHNRRHDGDSPEPT